MNVQLIDSVAEFLELTAERRAADPLRTNVIGSVAHSVSSGRSHYDEYRWWVVTDDSVVVALAMRTSPHAMVLAPMSNDAATLLGESLGQLDDEIPGMSGSRDVVEHVLQGYQSSGSSGSRRASRVERRDLMYELDTLTAPSVEGRGRVALEFDIESLTSMYMAFVDEAHLSGISLDDARDSVTKGVQERAYFCWEHENEIVSFAGHAALVRAGTTLVGRVGPVYTPPEFRRHGYASAVTAMVSQHLLDRGARVMLLTDSSNSTSNAIYQVLGYRLLDELVDLRIT